MPITDSRLKTGTLTLDLDQGGTGAPVSFATQATNVRLVPSTDTVGDELEVLSGDTVDPEDETSWTLAITSVQDFDDPAGFVATCLDYAGQLVDYAWKPNANSPTYTGTCRVRPVEIGGEVAARLTTDAEFPCMEKPTAAYPA